jgi:hypothetical protein
MCTHRATRSATVLMVVPMLVVGVACGGGGGKTAATPSTASYATPVATGTPIATPAATRTPEPPATPRPAATIELSADPKQLTCDGVQASTVTARVLDSTGKPVDNGTSVHFSVQVLGSADPVDAQTVAGVATTSVTARGQGVGVVVNVTSGDAAAAIRVDCL